MVAGALGREYQDGETICRQGERAASMYVLQSGAAVVVREEGDQEVVVGRLGSGDVFGEMSLFDGTARSATVRVEGESRVLTLDKRAFLRQVHEDPSLAFRILENMSRRIRSLNEELVQLRR